MVRARQSGHTGTENEVAHSQLGRPQIQASNRAPHQQEPPPPSGTTAKVGSPAPAGGSRGSRTPSKIPWLPRPHLPVQPSNSSPDSLLSLRTKTVRLAWAGCRGVTSGFSAEGFRAPDLPPLLSYSSVPSTKLHKREGVVSTALGTVLLACLPWPGSASPAQIPVCLVFELRVTQRSWRGASPPGLCGQPLQEAS